MLFESRASAILHGASDASGSADEHDMLRRMLRSTAVILLSVLCGSHFSAAQSTAAPTPADTAGKTSVLSPSEAYRYAMQPFVDARSAPNDLTDADQWALGLGASRAHEQCEALVPTKLEGEDLLAMGKLCTFGQDLGPAEDALTAYLGLPKMADEKSARLVLTRIFVQLNSVTSAESQIETLVSTFPYDADIHWAIDQVIDAAEAEKGGVSTVKMDGEDTTHSVPVPAGDSRTVRVLNELQLPFILKALAAGGTLKTSDSTVDAAVMVRDGLRCADAMRQAGKQKDAADLVEQLKTLTLAPAIMQSASEPAIESAFARYILASRAAPIQELRGMLVTKTPVPAIRRFAGKTTVLVAFSLGAPQFHDAVTKLDAQLEHLVPKQPMQLIAITSYAAMNGVDEKSDEVLKTLQALQTTLPPSMLMMIVPETDLKAFAIDAFPAAAVIDSAGKIAYLNLFPGTAGSVQLVLRAVDAPAAPPSSTKLAGAASRQ